MYIINGNVHRIEPTDNMIWVFPKTTDLAMVCSMAECTAKNDDKSAYTIYISLSF